MQIGIWQILVIALLVVLLFGRGKISSLMGDVAQGIKNFKKGMADDTPPPATDATAPSPAQASSAPASPTQVQPAATPVTPPATPSAVHTPPVPTAGASVAPNSNTPDTRAS
jgi:sec-independent protein translocase protein TatA